MKDKPSEWVSIADLMSGVLAVVMLLLVISAVQKAVSDAEHAARVEELAQKKGRVATEILSALDQSTSTSSDGALLSINADAGKITLRDTAFKLGSACITLEGRSSTGLLQDEIVEFLNKVPDGRIYVEGHTDSYPVLRPQTDFERFCTVYDDNFTLSAARAREVRKLLIEGLSESSSKRVLVAGYGESQLLPGISPTDSRNRRVEIRFLASGN